VTEERGGNRKAGQKIVWVMRERTSIKDTVQGAAHTKKRPSSEMRERRVGSPDVRDRGKTKGGWPGPIKE